MIIPYIILMLIGALLGLSVSFILPLHQYLIFNITLNLIWVFIWVLLWKKYVYNTYKVIVFDEDSQSFLIRKGWIEKLYLDITKQEYPKGYWWSQKYLRYATRFNTFEKAKETFNKRMFHEKKIKHKKVYP